MLILEIKFSKFVTALTHLHSLTTHSHSLTLIVENLVDWK